MSKWIVRVAIGFAVLMGIVVLLGWQFDNALLKQGFLNDPATIKANSAVCFILAGMTLSLLQLESSLKPRSRPRWLQILSSSLIWSMISVGALTLSQHIWDWNLGIDELLFRDPLAFAQPHPGRMGEATAVNFILFGISCLLLRQSLQRAHWIAQLLSCVIVGISLLALVGYLFGAEIFYGFLLGTTTAAPAATIVFIALALGELFLYPDRGLMRTVTSSLLGGKMARQLLPWAIGFPFLLNWVIFQGEQLHWYSAEFAAANRTVITITLLSGVIWWTARSLNHMDQRRQQSEVGLQQLNAELEQRVVERTTALITANDRLRQELAERQQLEQELAERQQLLDNFFDAASTANIGLCIHDQNLCYISINQALAEANGISIQGHLGRTMAEVLPDLSPTITPLLQQVLTTGEPITDLEVCGMTAVQPQQMHDWRVSYFPIFDHNNHVIAVGVMVIDITDRKRAEQLVQASETRYRAIVEDQTELICRYLPDGTIRFINGAYCRYFGLNQESMIGKSYAPVVFEEDQEKVTESVRSMNANNPTVLIENRVVVGNEVRWTQWINRMLFNEQGQFIEYQSVGRDITELKQVEAALQEQQAILSGIISGIQDIVAAIDRNFCLITFNQTYHDEFLKIFGYDVQVGTNLVEALAHLPVEQTRVIELWQRSLAGEEFTLTEEFGDINRQRNYYEISYSTIRNAQGQQIGATVIARDVSDRQRTEQLLRESEERYRSVVTAMAEGIVLQQGTGEITAWNQSAERILGLTAEQLLGQTSLNLEQRTICEDGSPFPAHLHPAMVTLKTGIPQSDVIMGIHKPDGITWISINSQPLFYPDQRRLYGVVASFTDITAHKLAEERLRDSEARFRSAFDDAAIGMALVALDGRFLQVNRALSEIVGYSASELVTLNFQRITFADDLESDLRYAGQLLKGEIRSYQMEKRYLHKQGRIVWALLNGSLVRDTSGKPLYFIAQMQDISDRKQAEQALELQAVITRNIAEGICLIRAEDGIIVYANPKFGHMLGYEPDELIGQSASIVHYANETLQADTITQTLIHQVTQSGEATYEIHTVKKDGTPLWCRATTSMFAHPEYGNVLVAVQQDITERKQVEEKVRASLKEKEVLLKEIHHRVKNNLQIVDGLLKMQSRRIQDPQISAVLRDSQSRIASIALVHEKLYRSADLANIDFAQYIRELTIHLLESYNVNSQTIQLHTQATGVFFEIETAIPCGLIINELVSNALKYAFPAAQAGDIWIELQPHDDHHWRLRVRDNGVGLPSDFDITNTRSLGMTLIQGLVEQLEGNLRITNDQGSNFEIIFPGSKI